MAIETTYRGYTIRYAENMDEWYCHEAGDMMSAPTLGKMREKIDRMLLQVRKASATRCLELVYGTPNVTSVSIIEYLGPKVDGGGYSQSVRRVVDHKVAAVGTRKGNERANRRTVDMRTLIPDTPEALAALDVAKGAYQAVKDAEAAYKAAMDAVPRITVDDITELVRISGIDPTGGIKQETKA